MCICIYIIPKRMRKIRLICLSNMEWDLTAWGPNHTCTAPDVMFQSCSKQETTFTHGDANPVKRLLTLIRSEVQQPPFPARKHWLPCGNNTSLYAHMYMYVYTYICVCVKLINVHICWITYMNIMHMFKYMYICIHFELYCGTIWYYFIFILLYYYTA
jgi:hypothetical protein